MNFFTAVFVCLAASVPSALASEPLLPLPDAPSAVLSGNADTPDTWSSSGGLALSFDPRQQTAPQVTAQPPAQTDKPIRLGSAQAVDAAGNPIPLSRQQPQRILGFMPNFRSVAAGAKPHPPGWKYNFTIATRQAFDYSSFIFLGLTTLSAEGLDEHPVLGKGIHGFYSYGWRGFLDKTDGTYLGAWLLPSLLHEDTRYYPLGSGHRIITRALYVISRQGVARTYSGHNTPNIAGLGAKVLTQVISREYYPTGATSFGVLAEKFGYAAMRDVGFSAIREFYPDVAAHYVRKHREKMTRMGYQLQQQQPAPPATHP